MEVMKRAALIPVDIKKNKGGYVIICELPGAKMNDIDLFYINGKIKISSVKKIEMDGNYILKEIGNETLMKRELELPSNIDSNGITASMDNRGLLFVKIPFAKGKRVKVKL